MARSQPNLILSAAVCVSLAAHAGIVGVLAERYSATAAQTIRIGSPRLQPIPMMPEATIPIFGEAMGGGESVRSAPGELPTIGRAGDTEQAAMSHDPVGEGGDGAVPLPPVAEAKPPVLLMAPPGLADAAIGLRRDSTGRSDETGESLPVAPLPEPVPITVVPAEPMPIDEQRGDAVPAVNGKPGAAGDPLPQGDYDSDPFSKTGSYVIRIGNMRARTGRAVVHAVRPKFLLAAQVDLATMNPVEVESMVQIDAAGKVIWAEVVRSNGTDNINQPVRVALYDWRFEPTIPGEPLPEKFPVTLTFR